VGKVALLTMSQVDWKQFITLCKETVGYSPTRGLDASASPTHKDPAAFLACVDLRNNPLGALKDGRQRGLFRHFFLSFMLTLEDESLIALQQTQLAIYSEKCNREYFVIASGSMADWHDAVIFGCKAVVPYELRISSNIIYDVFLNMGFRASFPYTKTKQPDGTFILK